jgi:hypothetical protein
LEAAFHIALVPTAGVGRLLPIAVRQEPAHLRSFARGFARTSNVGLRRGIGLSDADQIRQIIRQRLQSGRVVRPLSSRRFSGRVMDMAELARMARTVIVVDFDLRALQPACYG